MICIQIQSHLHSISVRICNYIQSKSAFKMCVRKFLLFKLEKWVLYLERREYIQSEVDQCWSHDLKPKLTSFNLFVWFSSLFFNINVRYVPSYHQVNSNMAFSCKRYFEISLLYYFWRKFVLICGMSWISEHLSCRINKVNTYSSFPYQFTWSLKRTLFFITFLFKVSIPRSSLRVVFRS